MTDDMPALLGGPAVRPEGPPDWPTADPGVLEALRAAHGDGSWGKYLGPNVARFEQLRPARPVLDNEVARGTARRIVAFNNRDLEEFVVWTAENMVFEDRRKGLGARVFGYNYLLLILVHRTSF